MFIRLNAGSFLRMFARLKARGAVAAVLVSALVAGGAFLGGGAAYAATPESVAVSNSAETQEAAANAADGAETEASTDASRPAETGDVADQGGGAAPSESAGESSSEETAAETTDEGAVDENTAPVEEPAAPAEARSAKAALPASLETVRENGGQLSWNFTDSWVSYLNGFGGTITPYGGATAGDNGLINFPEAASTAYDAQAGTGVIAYTGGVEWDNPKHGFTIAMQNLQMKVAADGSATLSAETSKTDTDGAAAIERVEIATVAALGTATDESDMRTWSGVAANFVTGLKPAGLSKYDGKTASPITLSTSVPAAPETVWNPAIQVFLGDSKTPLAAGAKVNKGDVLTIKGTGFDPASNVGGYGMPIPSTLSQGAYVVFGKFADTWRPSEGAKGAARAAGPQGWVLPESVVNQVDAKYQDTIRGQWVQLADDGSWTAKLTLADPAKAGTITSGDYGVYTYGAGGVVNASQELKLALDYADSARTFTPEMQVFLGDSKKPLAAGAKVNKGDVLTIKGTGFDPASNVGGYGMPIPSTLSQGAYVVFGKFADTWRPSEGAKGAARAAGPQGWVLPESVVNQVDAKYQDTIRAQWIELAADGSWTAKLTLADPAKAGTIASGDYGVYTYGAGGVVNASQELKLALDYTDEQRVFTPEIQVFLGDSKKPLAAGTKVYKDDVLTIKGTGFDPASNVGGYGMPIPSTLSQGAYVVFGKFADTWRPSEGAKGAARAAGPQGWVLPESVVDQVDEKYQDTIRAQWVELAADGSWTAKLTLADPAKAGTIVNGDYGVYTYGAGGVVNASQELKLGLDYVNDVRQSGPSLQVFVGDSKTPLKKNATVYKGDVLTIKGAGFDPEANVGGRGMPVPKHLPQGSYVVFGKFAPNWKPSADVASSQRVVSSQGWVLTESVLNQVDPKFQGTIRDQWVPFAEDGTWEAKLTVSDSEKAAALLDGRYGVYTYAAGGMKNAEEELELNLRYVDSERPEGTMGDPEIRVYKADGVTLLGNSEVHEGDKLVVKGSGFDPYANLGGIGQPIPADKPQGTFVVFGSFADKWQPSQGATSAERTWNKESRAWLLAKDTLEHDVPDEHRALIEQQWAELDPITGSFTATITVKQPEKALANGKYGIYTYAGGVNTENKHQELRSLVNFTGKPEQPKPQPKTGGLQWGVKGSFVNYIENQSGDGKVTLGGSAKRNGDVFSFVQQKGGTWNADKATGEARYSGSVTFSAHKGELFLLVQDPIITVKNETTAVMTAVTLDDKGKETRIPFVDIALPKKTVDDSGSVTWTDAKTTLRAEAVGVFQQYKAGEALDPVTFTVGKASETVEPTKPVVKPTKPTPKPKPKPIVVPTGTEKQPGSLTWGISSGFAGYTTGKIAKGAVTSDGVGRSGGAYVFPQASSSWNTASQTGTVQFSGVVTFTGHKGAMVETFSNPVITVNSASSGTLNAGGRTFSLDLGSASKVVGANGEVTWNGVSVGGAISGGGSAGGGSGAGSFSADPLSFTVGAANSANYGSTEQTAPSTKRTAADTPPATTGIKLITDKKKLIPGAEIEFEATGFEPNERDILVVLYSDPIVLDDAAGADENGVVRWIGNLPKDLKPGEHTLTLQGSKNAGVVMTVLSKEEAKAKAKAELTAEPMTAQSGMSAKAESGNLADTGSQLWIWWTAAIVLLVLAVIGAALVVRQRRTIE
ncbi:HtaA domain-containing protein [Leucobacter sp. 1207-22]|uniref:HtaA domain-containing protein n=1 Tax=Leucobacter sp. 1207-22 TaxID=2604456 RepID=UPI004064B172